MIICISEFNKILSDSYEVINITLVIELGRKENSSSDLTLDESQAFLISLGFGLNHLYNFLVTF